MDLTLRQKELIVEVDHQVKEIIEGGGTEREILIKMFDRMSDVKELLEIENKEELERHLQKHYQGVYQYIKILEVLAQKIADGSIKAPQ